MNASQMNIDNLAIEILARYNETNPGDSDKWAAEYWLWAINQEHRCDYPMTCDACVVEEFRNYASLENSGYGKWSQ